MSKYKKKQVDGDDFDFWSEECCSECEEIFDTKNIVTKCPDCGKEVVSCNACDCVECAGCILGSNFNLYGTDRPGEGDEPMPVKEEPEWYDGGKEDGSDTDD